MGSPTEVTWLPLLSFQRPSPRPSGAKQGSHASPVSSAFPLEWQPAALDTEGLFLVLGQGPQANGLPWHLTQPPSANPWLPGLHLNPATRVLWLLPGALASAFCVLEVWTPHGNKQHLILMV